MSKKVKSPIEEQHLTIELADNGIILRNPDCEDEVTLALRGIGTHKPDGYGFDIDHSEEYRAIGKRIYDWLMDVVLQEHDDMITTGFDLTIQARCTGRDMED